MRNLVILLIFVSCALSVAAGKCRRKLKILSSDSECEGGETVSWIWLVTAPPHMKTFYIGEWWGVIWETLVSSVTKATVRQIMLDMLHYIVNS